jgi:hypothetical protein
MGYSLEHKGYCCYDKLACLIHFSRDVSFTKDQPFFSSSSTRSSSYTSLESTSFLSLPPIFSLDELDQSTLGSP